MPKRAPTAASGLSLQVKILKGRNLAAKDDNGLSDPYCMLQLGTVIKRTKVVKESLNPTWNAEFTFSGSKCEPITSLTILRLALYDEDRLSDDAFLGDVIIPVGYLTAADEKPHWRTIGVRPGSDEYVSGEVFLSITKQGDESSPAAPAGSSAKKQKGKAEEDDKFGLLPQYIIDPDELDFSDAKVLGKGAFGMVRTANFRGLGVAVKTMILKEGASKAEKAETVSDFQLEVGIMSKSAWGEGVEPVPAGPPSLLRHRLLDLLYSVIDALESRMHAVSHHPKLSLFLGASVREPLTVITELMSGGSVRSLLEKATTPIPWERRLEITLDGALGLAFLHKCDPPVIHRDLKCDNLLLDSHGQAKLADFGFTKTMQGTDAHEHEILGTPGFMAPEMYDDDEGAEGTPPAPNPESAAPVPTRAARLPAARACLGRLVSSWVLGSRLRLRLPLFVRLIDGRLRHACRRLRVRHDNVRDPHLRRLAIWQGRLVVHREARHQGQAANRGRAEDARRCAARLCQSA